MQVFLIFGKTGWIGGLVGGLLKEQGANFSYANCRLEDRASVMAELDRVRTFMLDGGEGKAVSAANLLALFALLLHACT